MTTQFKQIMVFFILLVALNSCADSGLKGILGGGGSDNEKAKSTTTDDSKKPTDNSEGVPGYLVDPELIELLVQESTATLQGGPGTVQSNSGASNEVEIKVYSVEPDRSGSTEILVSGRAEEDGSFALSFDYNPQRSIVILVGPADITDGSEIESLVTGTFFVIDDPDSYMPEDEESPFDSRAIRVSFTSSWDPDYGSISTTIDLPVGQIVSGTFVANVRVVVNNSPVELMWVKIKSENALGGEIILDETCPYDGTTDNTCAFNYPIEVDTNNWLDGWRDVNVELRTKTPDDKRLVVESGIPLYADNGKGDSTDAPGHDCGNKSIRNEGDYNDVDKPSDNIDFPEVILKCTPLIPVSGTWELEFKGREDPTGNIVAVLDRQFAAPAIDSWTEQVFSDGTVVYDQPVDATEWHKASIDTTTLDNGWHTISLSASKPGVTSDCGFCSGSANTATGSLQVRFYVQN